MSSKKRDARRKCSFLIFLFAAGYLHRRKCVTRSQSTSPALAPKHKHFVGLSETAKKYITKANSVILARVRALYSRRVNRPSIAGRFMHTQNICSIAFKLWSLNESHIVLTEHVFAIANNELSTMCCASGNRVLSLLDSQAVIYYTVCPYHNRPFSVVQLYAP